MINEDNMIFDLRVVLNDDKTLGYWVSVPNKPNVPYVKLLKMLNFLSNQDGHSETYKEVYKEVYKLSEKQFGVFLFYVQDVFEE